MRVANPLLHVLSMLAVQIMSMQLYPIFNSIPGEYSSIPFLTNSLTITFQLWNVSHGYNSFDCGFRFI